MSKFDRAAFLMSVLVFVSHDFELGRTWLTWGVDRQSRPGLIFIACCFWQALIDLKMYEKADDNFIRAIELEPDNGNIYVHRGFVLLAKAI